MLEYNMVSINELEGLLGSSSPKVTIEYYSSIIESKNKLLEEIGTDVRRVLF